VTLYNELIDQNYRSCAKLAYEDAQLVIDGGNLPSDIELHGDHDLKDLYTDIFMLYQLSVEMRKQRYAGGSLSLNSVKLQFELDDRGQPISVSSFETKAANRLVEEFMLRANISVAEKISKTFKDESLLRRHQDPLEKRLVRTIYIYIYIYI
jgi:protein SSD1